MVHSIIVDVNLCNKCKICVDVCFVNVFKWDEANNVPVAAYPEDCQICCLCELQCPTKAITVVPDWSCRHYPKVLKAHRR